MTILLVYGTRVFLVICDNIFLGYFYMKIKTSKPENCSSNVRISSQ